VVAKHCALIGEKAQKGEPPNLDVVMSKKGKVFLGLEDIDTT